MPMTARRCLFVAYYLGVAKGNATLAARMAGFGHPDKAGPRLLTCADVASAVEAKLEKAAMGAEEVLARLSSLARSDMGDFLRFDADSTPGTAPAVDFRRARRRESLGTIRKLKSTSRTTPGRGDGPPTVETTVELELLDPTKALAVLARYHGLDKPAAGAGSDPYTINLEWEDTLARLYGDEDDPVEALGASDQGRLAVEAAPS